MEAGNVAQRFLGKASSLSLRCEIRTELLYGLHGATCSGDQANYSRAKTSKSLVALMREAPAAVLGATRDDRSLGQSEGISVSAGEWLLILTFGGAALVAAVYVLALIWGLGVMAWRAIADRRAYRRLHRG